MDGLDISELEKRAQAKEALRGRPRCGVCHGKGLAGEHAPGRRPGDARVVAETTGFFFIEDDVGRLWQIDPDESDADRAAFFDEEERRAHADVAARFGAIRAVLERLALMPDQQFVPTLRSRLIDLQEWEAEKQEAMAKEQATEAEKKHETKRDKAYQWLLAMFAKAPVVAAKDVADQAKAAGITRDALHRALRLLRDEQRAEVWKEGRGGWYWRLLPSEVQNISCSDCGPQPDTEGHGCQAPVEEADAPLPADAVIPAQQRPDRPIERLVVAPRTAPTSR